MNSTDKKMKLASAGRSVQMIFGWIFLVIGLMGLIMILTADTAPIWVIFVYLFWGLIGAVLVIYGLKKKRMQTLYLQYISILNSHVDGRIDDLARNTQSTESKTISNLQYMIEHGWFKNAFINRDTQQLIITRKNNPAFESADPALYTSCTCPTCGGVNRIKKGQATECDFCGNILRG